MKRLHLTLIKGFLAGLAFMVGIMTMGLLAITISGTIKTWTSGERLTAEDLNTTINSLKTAIESIPNWTKSGTTAVYNDGNVTVSGKVSSSNLGVYCGISATIHDGSGVGGPSGAKSKCQAACANTNAHMCSSHEIAMSTQSAVSFGTFPSTYGWIYVGVNLTSPGGQMNDCVFWNNASAAQWGIIIDNSGNTTYASCNNSYHVACCL
jgi:hypothetical protein